MKILIIEDDQKTALTIQQHLGGEYKIDTALTAAEGLYMSEDHEYDLYLLEFHLPDLDGVKLASKLRSSGVTAPILMLTSKECVSTKVNAFEAGVDDYLVKPFDYSELKARIRAVLRRTAPHASSTVITVADLSFDLEKKSVVRNGVKIILRKKELDLLEYLMRNAGRVITREMILNHVWDNAYESFTNTVDVHIKYLRDQIDRPFAKKLIKTLHGLGYKIED